MRLQTFLAVFRGVFALVVCECASSGAALADPNGLWRAQDGATVHVSPCGSALCATMASTKSPLDPATGKPWTDKHNADPNKRNRPLVGVQVLSSMRPSSSARWSGTLYNIDDGKTYPGHLIEIGPSTIRIEGCSLGICGGEELSRVR